MKLTVKLIKKSTLQFKTEYLVSEQKVLVSGQSLITNQKDISLKSNIINFKKITDILPKVIIVLKKYMDIVQADKIRFSDKKSGFLIQK